MMSFIGQNYFLFFISYKLLIQYILKYNGQYMMKLHKNRNYREDRSEGN